CLPIGLTSADRDHSPCHSQTRGTCPIVAPCTGSRWQNVTSPDQTDSGAWSRPRSKNSRSKVNGERSETDSDPTRRKMPGDQPEVSGRSAAVAARLWRPEVFAVL